MCVLVMDTAETYIQYAYMILCNIIASAYCRVVDVISTKNLFFMLFRPHFHHT